MPLQCRLCGSAPAADVTFRQHLGMVILMQERRSEGPFCRECGIATFRNVQNRTLLTGWWGVLSLLVFSWLTPLRNLLALRRVRALAPPVRDPAVSSPLPAPLQPGRPVWMRLGPVVPLLLAAVVATVVTVRLTTPDTSIDPNSNSLVGHCVTIRGDALAGIVGCGGPHAGVIVQRVVQAGLGNPCEAGDAFRFLRDGVVLCVDRNR